MKSGSASDSQETGASSNTTFALDTTSRLLHGCNAFYGETNKNGGNIADAVYAAELRLPVTKTWTTVASMPTPREYHSAAILLPEWLRASIGDGADFGNAPDELSAEFYSPLYLFKGARPTITRAPTQIAYANSLFVGTPDAPNIESAVLIQTGTVTHFVDQNTRYVPLTFQ